ncbi:hypothetical protein [Kiloniella antarctica]|uniref:Zinc-finger domain-containing protein n=1 Tax=Kiloniella antarctica TaxID=1550907 RepID=A0ABW5BLU1_9PROT
MSRNIEELLPFYVNGSLEGEDLEIVKKALSEDKTLQDECIFLQGLREEVYNQGVENSPGEFGLKRLQRDISREKVAKTKFVPKNNTVVTFGTRGWRLAAIAACIVLLFQTVYVLPQWQNDDDLIAASGGSIHQARGPVVSITFVPEAQEENIRELLLAVDARIVDGPSALGVYKLVLTKDPETIISKLLAHKNLVETVQREGGESGGQ